MRENKTKPAHRVEWFVAGDCPRCGPLLDAVEARCANLALEFTRVPVLAALDRAVALGVLRPPALVLDGRLLIQGAFAPRKAAERLHAELATEANDANR
ncbi:MAG: hypothetical protein ACRER1_08455 [Gammaproteobacteria bacterium]